MIKIIKFYNLQTTFFEDHIFFKNSSHFENFTLKLNQRRVTSFDFPLSGRKKENLFFNFRPLQIKKKKILWGPHPFSEGYGGPCPTQSLSKLKPLKNKKKSFLFLGYTEFPNLKNKNQLDLSFHIPFPQILKKYQNHLLNINGGVSTKKFNDSTKKYKKKKPISFDFPLSGRKKEERVCTQKWGVHYSKIKKRRHEQCSIFKFYRRKYLGIGAPKGLGYLKIELCSCLKKCGGIFLKKKQINQDTFLRTSSSRNGARTLLAKSLFQKKATLTLKNNRFGLLPQKLLIKQGSVKSRNTIRSFFLPLSGESSKKQWLHWITAYQILIFMCSATSKMFEHINKSLQFLHLSQKLQKKQLFPYNFKNFVCDFIYFLIGSGVGVEAPIMLKSGAVNKMSTLQPKKFKKFFNNEQRLNKSGTPSSSSLTKKEDCRTGFLNSPFLNFTSEVGAPLFNVGRPQRNSSFAGCFSQLNFERKKLFTVLKNNKKFNVSDSNVVYNPLDFLNSEGFRASALQPSEVGPKSFSKTGCRASAPHPCEISTSHPREISPPHPCEISPPHPCEISPPQSFKKQEKERFQFSRNEFIFKILKIKKILFLVNSKTLKIKLLTQTKFFFFENPPNYLMQDLKVFGLIKVVKNLRGRAPSLLLKKNIIGSDLKTVWVNNSINSIKKNRLALLLNSDPMFFLMGSSRTLFRLFFFRLAENQMKWGRSLFQIKIQSESVSIKPTLKYCPIKRFGGTIRGYNFCQQLFIYSFYNLRLFFHRSDYFVITLNRLEIPTIESFYKNCLESNIFTNFLSSFLGFFLGSFPQKKALLISNVSFPFFKKMPTFGHSLREHYGAVFKKDATPLVKFFKKMPHSGTLTPHPWEISPPHYGAPPPQSFKKQSFKNKMLFTTLQFFQNSLVKNLNLKKTSAPLLKVVGLQPYNHLKIKGTFKKSKNEGFFFNFKTLQIKKKKTLFFKRLWGRNLLGVGGRGPTMRRSCPPLKGCCKQEQGPCSTCFDHFKIKAPPLQSFFVTTKPQNVFKFWKYNKNNKNKQKFLNQQTKQSGVEVFFKFQLKNFSKIFNKLLKFSCFLKYKFFINQLIFLLQQRIYKISKRNNLLNVKKLQFLFFSTWCYQIFLENIKSKKNNSTSCLRLKVASLKKKTLKKKLFLARTLWGPYPTTFKILKDALHRRGLKEERVLYPTSEGSSKPISFLILVPCPISKKSRMEFLEVSFLGEFSEYLHTSNIYNNEQVCLELKKNTKENSVAPTRYKGVSLFFRWPHLLDESKKIVFLEPEWEAIFEDYSLGFRPGWSVYDAIDVIVQNFRFPGKYFFHDKIETFIPTRSFLNIPEENEVRQGPLPHTPERLQPHTPVRFLPHNLLKNKGSGAGAPLFSCLQPFRSGAGAPLFSCLQPFRFNQTFRVPVSLNLSKKPIIYRDFNVTKEGGQKSLRLEWGKGPTLKTLNNNRASLVPSPQEYLKNRASLVSFFTTKIQNLPGISRFLKLRTKNLFLIFDPKYSMDFDLKKGNNFYERILKKHLIFKRSWGRGPHDVPVGNETNIQIRNLNFLKNLLFYNAGLNLQRNIAFLKPQLNIFNNKVDFSLFLIQRGIHLSKNIIRIFSIINNFHKLIKSSKTILYYKPFFNTNVLNDFLNVPVGNDQTFQEIFFNKLPKEHSIGIKKIFIVGPLPYTPERLQSHTPGRFLPHNLLKNKGSEPKTFKTLYKVYLIFKEFLQKKTKKHILWGYQKILKSKETLSQANLTSNVVVIQGFFKCLNKESFLQGSSSSLKGLFLKKRPEVQNDLSTRDPSQRETPLSFPSFRHSLREHYGSPTAQPLEMRPPHPCEISPPQSFKKQSFKKQSFKNKMLFTTLQFFQNSLVKNLKVVGQGPYNNKYKTSAPLLKNLKNLKGCIQHLKILKGSLIVRPRPHNHLKILKGCLTRTSWGPYPMIFLKSNVVYNPSVFSKFSRKKSKFETDFCPTSVKKSLDLFERQTGAFNTSVIQFLEVLKKAEKNTFLQKNKLILKLCYLDQIKKKWGFFNHVLKMKIRLINAFRYLPQTTKPILLNKKSISILKVGGAEVPHNHLKNFSKQHKFRTSLKELSFRQKLPTTLVNKWVSLPTSSRSISNRNTVLKKQLICSDLLTKTHSLRKHYGALTPLVKLKNQMLFTTLQKRGKSNINFCPTLQFFQNSLVKNHYHKWGIVCFSFRLLFLLGTKNNYFFYRSNFLLKSIFYQKFSIQSNLLAIFKNDFLNVPERFLPHTPERFLPHTPGRFLPHNLLKNNLLKNKVCFWKWGGKWGGIVFKQSPILLKSSSLGPLRCKASFKMLNITVGKGFKKENFLKFHPRILLKQTNFSHYKWITFQIPFLPYILTNQLKRKLFTELKNFKKCLQQDGGPSEVQWGSNSSNKCEVRYGLGTIFLYHISTRNSPQAFRYSKESGVVTGISTVFFKESIRSYQKESFLVNWNRIFLKKRPIFRFLFPYPTYRFYGKVFSFKTAQILFLKNSKNAPLLKRGGPLKKNFFAEKMAPFCRLFNFRKNTETFPSQRCKTFIKNPLIVKFFSKQDKCKFNSGNFLSLQEYFKNNYLGAVFNKDATPLVKFKNRASVVLFSQSTLFTTKKSIIFYDNFFMVLQKKPLFDIFRLEKLTLLRKNNLFFINFSTIKSSGDVIYQEFLFSSAKRKINKVQNAKLKGIPNSKISYNDLTDSFFLPLSGKSSKERGIKKSFFAFFLKDAFQRIFKYSRRIFKYSKASFKKKKEVILKKSFKKSSKTRKKISFVRQEKSFSNLQPYNGCFKKQFSLLTLYSIFNPFINFFTFYSKFKFYFSLFFVINYNKKDSLNIPVGNEVLGGRGPQTLFKNFKKEDLFFNLRPRPVFQKKTFFLPLSGKSTKIFKRLWGRNLPGVWGTGPFLNAFQSIIFRQLKLVKPSVILKKPLENKQPFFLLSFKKFLRYETQNYNLLDCTLKNKSSVLIKKWDDMGWGTHSLRLRGSFPPQESIWGSVPQKYYKPFLNKKLNKGGSPFTIPSLREHSLREHYGSPTPQYGSFKKKDATPLVKFKNGLFKNGLFKNGLFKNGLFKNGLFKNPVLKFINNKAFKNIIRLSSIPKDYDLKRQKIYFQYAESIFIMHPDIQTILKCKLILENWFSQYGLTLSKEEFPMAHRFFNFRSNSDPTFPQLKNDYYGTVFKKDATPLSTPQPCDISTPHPREISTPHPWEISPPQFFKKQSSKKRKAEALQPLEVGQGPHTPERFLPHNLLKNKVFFWKWKRGLKLKKRSSLEEINSLVNIKRFVNFLGFYIFSSSKQDFSFKKHQATMEMGWTSFNNERRLKKNGPSALLSGSPGFSEEPTSNKKFKKLPKEVGQKSFSSAKRKKVVYNPLEAGWVPHSYLQGVPSFQPRNSSLEVFIQPSKSNLRDHLEQIKQIIHHCRAKTQEYLITQLAPVIRSWCSYFQILSNKKIFYYCDYLMFKMLWKWACRRHNNKSRKWVKMKYFHTLNNKNWVFGVYTKSHDYKAEALQPFLNKQGPRSSIFLPLSGKSKEPPLSNVLVFLCLPNHSDTNLVQHSFKGLGKSIYFNFPNI